jgi:hypothetical protein
MSFVLEHLASSANGYLWPQRSAAMNALQMPSNKLLATETQVLYTPEVWCE